MIPPRIDHVGLNVRDLDESIAFYTQLFGFSVIDRWDDPKQAFVGAGDVVLGLMEVTGYDFRAYTMAHIAFPCERASFPSAVVAIRDMGAEVVSGPKPQRGGETILFRDPSGNIVEVCYPSLHAWAAGGRLCR
ncbi:VOC family protein [Methyloterricola oryzae]|uniref:VOC family protein n=1 Tax=Methyloterricola oryzae TaxID=1495050 RepID=UPI0006997E5B|nr:VOC family protein [Methyloterricola oryzae]